MMSAYQQQLETVRRKTLTIKEAATVLGVCETTMRKLLPQIKHHRFGRAIRINPEDLDAWRLQSATTPEPEPPPRAARMSIPVRTYDKTGGIREIPIHPPKGGRY